jgi:hypothetical protein
MAVLLPSNKPITSAVTRNGRLSASSHSYCPCLENTSVFPWWDRNGSQGASVGGRDARHRGRPSARLTESYERKKVISKRQKDKSSFASLLVSFLFRLRYCSFCDSRAKCDLLPRYRYYSFARSRSLVIGAEKSTIPIGNFVLEALEQGFVALFLQRVVCFTFCLVLTWYVNNSVGTLVRKRRRKKLIG